jgi:hypothetical protein
MRRPLILSCAFVLSAPTLLTAQTIRWNDRPAGSWTDDAPRVRVWFDGARAVPSGAPMRVRFEVSDNAFVTVVRVADDGRMTILYPRSRNQRAAVRANQVYFANNPRLGSEISFFSSGSIGGYIFALASYAPLDFSGFEYRDFERVGGWSTFTQVNRPIARRPDVFIDRFAASVLWDKDTPYDYDVDYYFPTGHPGILNAYALCGSLYNSFGSSAFFRYAPSAWDDWDLVGYPYRSMCREWYTGIRCLSYLPLYSYTGCTRGSIIVVNPTMPPVDQPVDTAGVPNEGVVRGGLFGPTPVPVIPAGADPPPMERPVGRFDQVRVGGEAGRGSEWDNIMSIPARATRKMKEEDARRERGANEGARVTFDRPDITRDKVEKPRTADANTRVQPPPREPTKAKGNSEPRRETTSRGGFGSSTGRTSEPRAGNPDRVNRPVETKSTGTTTSPNPPSVQGTTTEKKKPPQN